MGDVERGYLVCNIMIITSKFWLSCIIVILF
jgi:hypothetical protein